MICFVCFIPASLIFYRVKVELAKKFGFKVLEIWSDDANNVDKCIEFIKNNIK